MSDVVNTATLSRIVTYTSNPTQTSLHEYISEISKLYRQKLAESVRLSAFEFDSLAINGENHRRPVGGSTRFSMSRDACTETHENP